jgi:hypothetical protein
VNLPRFSGVEGGERRWTAIFFNGDLQYDEDFFVALFD